MYHHSNLYQLRDITVLATGCLSYMTLAICVYADTI